MILLWKKGTRVLTAGEMMIRRADKIILKGTDLQVQNVSPEDGGIYSCEIEADSEYPLVVTHTLEVLGKFEWNWLMTICTECFTDFVKLNFLLVVQFQARANLHNCPAASKKQRLI